MQRVKFVCLATFLLISSFALAAEQTVKGKIKTVDVAKNSITLDDLTLDVTRKTKITVDGKNATIGELKVGRSADVKYDDVLDAAITISVEKDVVPSQPQTKAKAGEISLLANDSLDGWKPSPQDEKSQWTLKNGILRLDTKGPSLVTEEKFSDFDLHFEFKLPSKAASGVFLRGRYEIQLVDSDYRTKEGKPLDLIAGCGSIWRQIAPSKNVYRGPNKWNTMDVKLAGNVVTIRMNNELIIDARSLDGVTPGALDESESEPGPIIVQNAEIPGIEFRNITITPIIEDESTSDDFLSTLPNLDGAESLIAADSLEGWYFKEEIKDNKSNREVKSGVLIYNNRGTNSQI